MQQHYNATSGTLECRLNTCQVVVSHVGFVFRMLCILQVVHCGMSLECELSGWVRYTRVLESAVNESVEYNNILEINNYICPL